MLQDRFLRVGYRIRQAVPAVTWGYTYHHYCGGGARGGAGAGWLVGMWGEYHPIGGEYHLHSGCIAAYLYTFQLMRVATTCEVGDPWCP